MIASKRFGYFKISKVSLISIVTAAEYGDMARNIYILLKTECIASTVLLCFLNVDFINIYLVRFFLIVVNVSHKIRKCNGKINILFTKFSVKIHPIRVFNFRFLKSVNLLKFKRIQNYRIFFSDKD